MSAIEGFPSFGYLMKRDIIKSSRKFKKRRELRGKDSEFYMCCIEFEMPIISSGIDVQKVIGDMRSQRRQ